LIAASAVFALSLKDLEDLLLGIGGIILGVWGVRSIVVQTELPDLTLVDIALALIILLLLLALAIRAARHFYRRSGFHRRA
jgi:membrane protein implicated in regulation of membrane protease activity